MRLLHVLAAVAVVAPILAQVTTGVQRVDLELLPFYKERVYTVDMSENLDDQGRIIWPENDGPWKVEMAALSKAESAQWYLDQPQISALRELIMNDVITPYLEPNPDGKKKGGSSTIALTVSVDENDYILQIYVHQKRLWFVLENDYAGSAKFEPVVERLIGPKIRIFNFDVGVVKSDESFVAEAAVWWTVRTFLPRAQRDLCMQLPIGKNPPDGLSPRVRKAPVKMAKNDPKHPAAFLLDAAPGQEFELQMAQAGELSGEQYKAHRKAMDAGLIAKGHKAAGQGNPWEFKKGHTMGYKLGNTYGVPFHSGQETYDWDSLDPKVMHHRYGGFYTGAINWATYSVRTGEAPPEWIGLAGKLGHPGLKAPYKVLGCNIVGPNIVKQTRASGVRVNAYSFNMMCGQKEEIWTSHKVATGLGLIGATEAPPENPSSDITYFRVVSLKDWPSSWKLSGIIATSVAPKTKFIDEDQEWEVCGSETLAEADARLVHKVDRKYNGLVRNSLVYYREAGAGGPPVTKKNMKEECTHSKLWEVAGWVEQTRQEKLWDEKRAVEGIKRQKAPGRLKNPFIELPIGVAAGVMLLGYVASRTRSKRRGRDEDDDEDEEAPRPKRSAPPLRAAPARTAPMKTCTACSARAYVRSTTCPGCGAAFPKKAKKGDAADAPPQRSAPPRRAAPAPPQRAAPRRRHAGSLSDRITDHLKTTRQEFTEAELVNFSGGDVAAVQETIETLLSSEVILFRDDEESGEMVYFYYDGTAPMEEDAPDPQEMRMLTSATSLLVLGRRGPALRVGFDLL